MDHGEGEGVLSCCDVVGAAERHGFNLRMKGRIIIFLAVLIIGFVTVSISVSANDSSSEEDTTDLIEQVKEQLGAVFENVDQETALNTFAFLKEKIAEGDLTTEEGLSNAIEEGKERFGIEISRQDAQKLVDTMEKLEDMGFSAEYVLDKTENLYKVYGAEFVDHVDEVVTGAVKNAVSGAISSFFENLASSVKAFFTGLFS